MKNLRIIIPFLFMALSCSAPSDQTYRRLRMDQPDYDRYWTDARVDRVLDVLEKYNIALEINPRYLIPSFDIIRKAKARGIKFTFGTNNVDADFGRLEYAVEAIDACGLTPDVIWVPSMSIRSSRPTVIYNPFD